MRKDGGRQRQRQWKAQISQAGIPDLIDGSRAGFPPRIRPPTNRCPSHGPKPGSLACVLGGFPGAGKGEAGDRSSPRCSFGPYRAHRLPDAPERVGPRRTGTRGACGVRGSNPLAPLSLSPPSEETLLATPEPAGAPRKKLEIWKAGSELPTVFPSLSPPRDAGDRVVARPPRPCRPRTGLKPRARGP